MELDITPSISGGNLSEFDDDALNGINCEDQEKKASQVVEKEGKVIYPDDDFKDVGKIHVRRERSETFNTFSECGMKPDATCEDISSCIPKGDEVLSTQKADTWTSDMIVSTKVDEKASDLTGTTKTLAAKRKKCKNLRKNNGAKVKNKLMKQDKNTREADVTYKVLLKDLSLDFRTFTCFRVLLVILILMTFCKFGLAEDQDQCQIESIFKKRGNDALLECTAYCDGSWRWDKLGYPSDNIALGGQVKKEEKDTYSVESDETRTALFIKLTKENVNQSYRCDKGFTRKKIYPWELPVFPDDFPVSICSGEHQILKFNISVHHLNPEPLLKLVLELPMFNVTCFLAVNTIQNGLWYNSVFECAFELNVTTDIATVKLYYTVMNREEYFSIHLQNPSCTEHNILAAWIIILIVWCTLGVVSLVICMVWWKDKMKKYYRSSHWVKVILIIVCLLVLGPVILIVSIVMWWYKRRGKDDYPKHDKKEAEPLGNGGDDYPKHDKKEAEPLANGGDDYPKHDKKEAEPLANGGDDNPKHDKKEAEPLANGGGQNGLLETEC